MCFDIRPNINILTKSFTAKILTGLMFLKLNNLPGVTQFISKKSGILTLVL